MLVWAYIWTLTYGGSPRSREEYRIQLTGVEPPLPENPDGPTLLLGYEPETKCFAGFDLRKHKAFSRRSPSIQINISALRAASKDGFAFFRKGNDEIAIGFRPDNILAYALNAVDLHESGADAQVLEALNRAAQLVPLADSEAEAIPQERRRIVAKVSRLVRDSDFRRKVTEAYDRTCAVTGLQMGLIEAAHILPVGADGSTDEVANGLCLSPTYHRAYDRGLIYLQEDFRMVVNEAEKHTLRELGLGGGLNAFQSYLGHEIHLPADRGKWPRAEFIRAANALRVS